MHQRTLASLCALALTISPIAAQKAAPRVAQFSVYQSVKGYRLTYPSGWQIADAKDRAAIERVGSLLHQDIDFSDVDVFIHAPSTQPVSAINVQVSPYIVSATQHNLGRWRDLLPQQLVKSGAGSPSNMEIGLTKVGPYDAILATFTVEIPSAGSLWEEQFVIPGERHTFIVTCESEEAYSPVAKSIFERALASFRIDNEPASTDSNRIHQILQEAKARQPEDSRIRTRYREVLDRHPQSFPEFQIQCADLRTVLDESDAMEKRKRQMLADLRVEFGNDAKITLVFDTLSELENISDRMEPVYRGMIACSDILKSGPPSKQRSFDEICVLPAQQQIDLTTPEVGSLVRTLQNEIQEYGTSLPADLLQAITQ